MRVFRFILVLFMAVGVAAAALAQVDDDPATRLSERNAPSIPGISGLKVVTAKGTTVLPTVWVDGQGLEFRAMAKIGGCSSAALEVEVKPSGRTFLNTPTFSGPLSENCRTRGCLAGRSLPSAAYLRPSGRTLDAQVRLRVEQRFAYFEGDPPTLVRCGGPETVRRPIYTPWLPYTTWFSPNAEPRINVQDEWYDSYMRPTDSITVVGAANSELSEVGPIMDNKWFTTRSTATAPFQVEWVGLFNSIANIDAVMDGKVVMVVKSVPACTQTIEMLRSVGFGERKWMVVAPETSIGPQPQNLSFKLPDDLRGYLWTSAHRRGREGETFIKVKCTGSQAFSHEFDVLGLSYKALGEVKASD